MEKKVESIIKEGEVRLTKRNGVNKSLYITVTAAQLLKSCKRSTKRSHSAIVSMLLEKYGPNISRDGRLLNI